VTFDELEARTRQFAIDVSRLTYSLRGDARVSAHLDQLTRAAASVSANHRAARRARSFREFAAKLHIVNEEIDEAAHWLDLVAELVPDAPPALVSLKREALELRAIFARSRKTVRARLSKGSDS
jgi:four helix bundle protein